MLDVVSGKVDATKLAGSITLSCVLAFVAFILQIMQALYLKNILIWVLLAFVGIAMALLNGIPMYMGVGINNDGRNIPVVSCGTTGCNGMNVFNELRASCFPNRHLLPKVRSVDRHSAFPLLRFALLSLSLRDKQRS